jgi:hypothetical protein
MATCAHCSGEITNTLLTDCCMPCLERAMDNLTSADIEATMHDLAKHGEAISIIKPDGSRERVDPVDFRNTDET